MYCKGEIWVNKDCSSEIRCRDSLAVLSVSSAVLAPPQLHWELTITTFFFSFFSLSYHTQQMGFVRILKYESHCQVAAFSAIFSSFSRRGTSDIYSRSCWYKRRAIWQTGQIDDVEKSGKDFGKHPSVFSSRFSCCTQGRQVPAANPSYLSVEAGLNPGQVTSLALRVNQHLHLNTPLSFGLVRFTSVQGGSYTQSCYCCLQPGTSLDVSASETLCTMCATPPEHKRQFALFSQELCVGRPHVFQVQSLIVRCREWQCVQPGPSLTQLNVGCCVS